MKVDAIKFTKTMVNNNLVPVDILIMLALAKENRPMSRVEVDTATGKSHDMVKNSLLRLDNRNILKRTKIIVPNNREGVGFSLSNTGEKILAEMLGLELER